MKFPFILIITIIIIIITIIIIIIINLLGFNRKKCLATPQDFLQQQISVYYPWGLFKEHPTD